MAVAGVLATALNTAAVRPKGLWLGGVDVLKDPGAKWGVPTESIQVIENGAGAVSAMNFVIDDPLIQIEIADGMEVRFHDIANDAPLFLGFVDHFDLIPAFGQQGRVIVASATGVEALLDWAITGTTFSVAAGTLFVDAVQALIAGAIGLQEIRALADPGTSFISTQAFPIANPPGIGGVQVTEAFALSAGTTIREGLRQLSAASAGGSGSGVASVPGAFVATIDFYRGLRVYLPKHGTGGTDYATITINDAPAGPVVAESLEHSVEAATVRGVLVFGNVVTAIVSDGSGKPGPYTRIDDASITTVTAARAAGLAYLAQYTSGVRGTLDRQDHTPTSGVHVGSLIVITDARVELAAESMAIASITRTFNASGREDWKIAYGGLQPSLSRQVRRLTRGTLS